MSHNNRERFDSEIECHHYLGKVIAIFVFAVQFFFIPPLNQSGHLTQDLKVHLPLHFKMSFSSIH